MTALMIRSQRWRKPRFSKTCGPGSNPFLARSSQNKKKRLLMEPPKIFFRNLPQRLCRLT